MVMVKLILVFGLITVVPTKWAADFTGGTRTGWIAAVLAVLLGSALAAATFAGSPGGFPGVVLSWLVLVATYAIVLKVPARSVIGFSIVVMALQLAFVLVLISLGYDSGSVTLAF